MVERGDLDGAGWSGSVTSENARQERDFDLLICDCDGVIVDSEIVADRVLAQVIGARFPGRGAETLLENSFGQQTETLLQRIVQHVGEPLPPDFPEYLRRLIDETLEREVLPIHGIRDALECVDRPIAVVSNSPVGRVKIAIRRAGLEHLIGDRIFSADMVAHPKPAPDVYLLAAATLGVEPRRCLVVEDSGPGVTAAWAAGMSVIGFTGASHIPSGHGATLMSLGADHVLTSMEFLAETIAKLRRNG